MTLDKKQHTASVGLAGCVGLRSLLLVSLVTPLTSNQAHAEGEVENTNDEDYVRDDWRRCSDAADSSVMAAGSDADAGIMPAAATNSTVTISFFSNVGKRNRDSD